jgi:hypothetical protein
MRDASVWETPEGMTIKEMATFVVRDSNRRNVQYALDAESAQRGREAVARNRRGRFSRK